MNLGKRFVSITPGRFGGRIANLLSMTGLEDHVLGDFRDVGVASLAYDEGAVQTVLDKKRDEAAAFLDRALED